MAATSNDSENNKMGDILPTASLALFYILCPPPPPCWDTFHSLECVYLLALFPVNFPWQYLETGFVLQPRPAYSQITV